MKASDKDPAKCECHNWSYCRTGSQIWPIVELADGTMPQLGHHPGCVYWIAPPHESLTGLDGLLERGKLTEALVALMAAYQDLYWSINPPKPRGWED